MAASGRIGRLGIDDDCDDHVGVGFGVRMAALWLWYLSWLYSNDVILLLFFLLFALLSFSCPLVTISSSSLLFLFFFLLCFYFFFSL
jgi:hypothetical protein